MLRNSSVSPNRRAPAMRTDVAIAEIKQALDQALAIADRHGLTSAARRIAAAKVEVLLVDLEGSKSRALQSLTGASQR